MSPDLPLLHEGAILVADAHCAPWRTSFINFLIALESGKIQTTQLILMGDVFDLLFGSIPDTLELNREAVDLLERLSHRLEIVYLEGNHDFDLGGIWSTIRIVPRASQPFLMRSGDTQLALAHGDIYTDRGYEWYTAVIRNRTVLKVLEGLNRFGGGFIVRKLIDMMKRKHHCKPIEGFETMIRHRLLPEQMGTIGYWIEGHYHQNKAFELGETHYVNLPAFACNERYFSVQSTQNQPQLHEAVFCKEPL